VNILALDCSLKTGWATLINSRIESGVQDFSKERTRGESPGMDFIRFNRWLEGMYLAGEKIHADGEVLSYGLVVFEQAHLRGGHATNLCVGMTTRVQEFAARIGAECMPVHTATLKKFATGSGRSGKEEMMLEFFKATGREPITDDEADAFFLLKYGMKEIGAMEEYNV
jgi:hypothetical protein